MNLTKTEEKLMGQLSLPSENQLVTNPYSGESIELVPEAIAVYYLIKKAERMADYKTMNKGLTMFRKYWTREYMVLLD